MQENWCKEENVSTLQRPRLWRSPCSQSQNTGVGPMWMVLAVVACAPRWNLSWWLRADRCRHKWSAILLPYMQFCYFRILFLLVTLSHVFCIVIACILGCYYTDLAASACICLNVFCDWILCAVCMSLRRSCTLSLTPSSSESMYRIRRTVLHHNNVMTFQYVFWPFHCP